MENLNALMRPIAGMINRRIKEKTPARKLCSELDGRSMALRVKDSSLAVYLLVDNGEISMSGTYANEPDVVVCGSIVALSGLAGAAGDDRLRQGDIDMSGDALVAQQFQRLLYYGRPDPEDELANVIGRVAAHGVGEFARGLRSWSQGARETMQQNVAEYLQEESRAVPGRDEIDSFQLGVDELRDDVARLEARVRRVLDTQQENGSA